MTKEFQEMVDRFAKARNLKKGSFLLLTQLPGESDSTTMIKGNSNDLFKGIVLSLIKLLNQCSDDTFKTLYNIAIQAMSDERTRRFQRCEVPKEEYEYKPITNYEYIKNMDHGEMREFFKSLEYEFMTHYDSIKNMSIDEMAEFLEGYIDCDYCPALSKCGLSAGCSEVIRAWLGSEVW